MLTIDTCAMTSWYYCSDLYGANDDLCFISADILTCCVVTYEGKEEVFIHDLWDTKSLTYKKKLLIRNHQLKAAECSLETIFGFMVTFKKCSKTFILAKIAMLWNHLKLAEMTWKQMKPHRN